jgi:hypothetical protein
VSVHGKSVVYMNITPFVLHYELSAVVSLCVCYHSCFQLFAVWPRSGSETLTKWTDSVDPRSFVNRPIINE